MLLSLPRVLPRRRRLFQLSQSASSSLSMRTVAEDIENLDQLMHLPREGCDSGQGFLLRHRPPPHKLFTTASRHSGTTERDAHHQPEPGHKTADTLFQSSKVASLMSFRAADRDIIGSPGSCLLYTSDAADE